MTTVWLTTHHFLPIKALTISFIASPLSLGKGKNLVYCWTNFYKNIPEDITVEDRIILIDKICSNRHSCYPFVSANKLMDIKEIIQKRNWQFTTWQWLCISCISDTTSAINEPILLISSNGRFRMSVANFSNLSRRPLDRLRLRLRLRLRFASQSQYYCDWDANGKVA